MVVVPSIWDIHAKYSGHQRVERQTNSSRAKKEL